MKITVFDEHHAAFIFWEEALRAGRFRKGSTLLHVDFHSDMDVPPLDESVYTADFRRLAREQLQINNFIVPAVMRGTFDEVLFLGRADPPQATTPRNVGSLRGEGRWITDNLKLPRERIARALYPDLRRYRYAVFNDARKIRARPVVLDIDLDYFCCALAPDPIPPIPLTRAQRDRIAPSLVTGDRYRLPVGPLALDGAGQLVWRKRRSAGQLIYNNSRPWIAYAVARFVRDLRVAPLAISVCRSVRSGFTPPQHAAFVEQTLLAHLQGRPPATPDPLTIPDTFAVAPHVLLHGEIIFNPINQRRIALNRDQLAIWQAIGQGETFGQMHRRLLLDFDIRPALAVDQLYTFLCNLKAGFFIQDVPA